MLIKLRTSLDAEHRLACNIILSAITQANFAYLPPFTGSFFASNLRPAAAAYHDGWFHACFSVRAHASSNAGFRLLRPDLLLLCTTVAVDSEGVWWRT